MFSSYTRRIWGSKKYWFSQRFRTTFNFKFCIFCGNFVKKVFPSYTGRFRDLKKSCLYQRFIATFFSTFILFCGNFDIKSYSSHIRHVFDIAKSTDFFRVLRQLFFWLSYFLTELLFSLKSIPSYSGRIWDCTFWYDKRILQQLLIWLRVNFLEILSGTKVVFLIYDTYLTLQ